MGSQRNDPEPAQPPEPKSAAEPAPRRRSPSAKRRRPRDDRAEATATDGLAALASMYDRLLDDSRTAFASGHLAVAYHALAAALHAAQDLEDQARLEEIEAEAQRQMQAIDASLPVGAFSTKAAAHRGAEPLWATLARQAELARHLLRTRLQASPLRDWM